MADTHRRENLIRAVHDPDAVQFRAEGQSGSGVLFGHLAVFERWTEINSVYEGRFLERLVPGSFEQTITERRDKMRVLYDHGKDPSIGNKPLGEILELREDGGAGVYYEVDLFRAHYVDELRPALGAGQLGASFRFGVPEGGDIWHTPSRATEHNPERLPERTITRVDPMHEFGPVTFPAYEAATAGLRSGTDEFIAMLTDPLFAVRMAERVGPRIAEQMIEQLLADGRSDETAQTPDDVGSGSTPTGTDPRAVVALAAAARAARNPKR